MSSYFPTWPDSSSDGGVEGLGVSDSLKEGFFGKSYIGLAAPSRGPQSMTAVL